MCFSTRQTLKKRQTRSAGTFKAFDLENKSEGSLIFNMEYLREGNQVNVFRNFICEAMGVGLISQNTSCILSFY
jgi:hypothetical protein